LLWINNDRIRYGDIYQPSHQRTPHMTQAASAMTADTQKDLANIAFHRLKYLLQFYGNTLSEGHETALTALLQLARDIASGTRQGRYRFGLPCGMGKTTAIRAFMWAIQKLDLDTPVIVACSKVEQLCKLKRELIGTDGIDPQRIGLLHSFTVDKQKAELCIKGFASEPSEGAGRQFLLVTHANTQSGDYKSWMRDRDAASGLVFYDESLVVSEAMTLPLKNPRSAHTLISEAGSLMSKARYEKPAVMPIAEWVDGAVKALIEATGAHKGSGVLTVEVPYLSPKDAADYGADRLLYTEQYPTISTLIEVATRGQELRVFTNTDTNCALISYVITVPDELKNVIVLDASDPIRELIQHDHRMRRAEDVLPLLRDYRDARGMSAIKRYDRVKVHFACEAGSRDAMSKLFSSGFGNNKAIDKLADLINSKPTECFVIFTYKDKDNIVYLKQIRDGLKRKGIDIDAGAEIEVDGKMVTRFRIAISTWGMETATNEYSYAENVVLLGVIFQPKESLAGLFLGQVDDLQSPDMYKQLNSIRYSECAHSIYQAANRSRMRTVDVIDGVTQARATNLYVIHKDASLKARLDVCMPGAEWVAWHDPDGVVVREIVGKTSGGTLALAIAARLKEYARQGSLKVSLMELKATTAPDVPETTWRRARSEALKLAGWNKVGSSVTPAFDVLTA
jgi:hypothetical protein